ncbi:MAG: dihydroxyacetone kinase subunit DhaK [Deferribacteraceae bacterium]|jgi:dihydroxyacetone kinase-like protein|nr:dihydroxyacetone kinase subunit DhaK [Deferribacteraceae bacterium]
MKKFINDPDSVVSQSLEGMKLVYSDLIDVNREPCFVFRKDRKVGKAALASGGGSGHEPLHAGYVGFGMLDAACPGNVFTSPTPDQMQAAAKAVDSGKGVLFIIKNYTGDIMNFEMAAALCESEGIKSTSVVINDDVAVKDSLYTAGRRGVGATVLVEKVCGAKAEEGAPLEKVAELARRCNENARSIGIAATSCIVPAAGKPTFTLADNELEFGIGIHGEPGSARIPIKPADELVEMMLEPILKDLPHKAGDEAIVMLNGMGGTPLIELYLLYAKAAEVLKANGLPPVRSLVGNYITSLEMQGFSITCLKADQEILSCWDAPVNTPALRW